MSRKTNGFTIVELLVVIVVIGVLAAITIVSYTGISQRAITASIQSDLSNGSKILKMYYIEYGTYPASPLDTSNCPTSPVADNKYCLKASVGNTFLYTSSTPYSTFTLTDTNSNAVCYSTTNNTSPTVGCVTHIFTDDFNRSNGGLGLNWTRLHGTGTASIVSGVAGVSVPYTTDAVYGYTGSTNIADATVSLTSLTSAYQYIRAAVRISADGASFYSAYAYDDGTHMEVYLLRELSGDDNILKSISTLSRVANPTISVKASGTTISALLNGTQVLSTTDSNLSSGSVGFVGPSNGSVFKSFSNFIANTP